MLGNNHGLKAAWHIVHKFYDGNQLRIIGIIEVLYINMLRHL